MEKKTKNRKRWLILFPILGMAAGILLLTYPFAMDQYNEYRNEQAISSMSSVYDRYEDYQEELERQLLNAQNYNAKLAGLLSGEAIVPDYEEQLTFDGGGVMGYIEIPKIRVKMILYHGTSDETLAVGAGHLEGSSLPVGGASTHAVITAHSGMKTMRAFDDIRELEAGDRILVTVLGKQLIYEVESSETVLPYETESLAIIPGEDRLTLITCTPYGINDHRLLVHAVRVIDTAGDLVSETEEPDAGTAEAEAAGAPEESLAAATEAAGTPEERMTAGTEDAGVPADSVMAGTEADTGEETAAGFRLDRRTIPLLAAILVCFGTMVYLIVRTTGGRRKGK